MSKINQVTNLFNNTKEDLYKSIANWQDYLTTASRLYKYSFDDQLLIYAQRPDATACANMEVWNKNMNRWIKRGSKGIALIRKDEGGKPNIEYIFDVADTSQIRGGKSPYLWEMKEEYHNIVIEKLSKMYGNIKKEDFVYSLMELTERAVEEHYREFLQDLNYDIEGSFLEGLDALNIDVSFRNAITVCVQFMVLTRCGIDASEYLEEEDFAGVMDFNTNKVLSHLGSSINLVSNEMLIAMGAVIKNKERENFKKHIENNEKIYYNKNVEFNTLKHESKTEEGITYEEQNKLYSKRGLSNTGHTDGGLGRLTGYSGQIRNVEGNLLEGAPQRDLQQNVTGREFMAPLGGSGQNSSGTSGNDDRSNDENTGSNRGIESQRPTSLGGNGNEHKSTSRGSYNAGNDLRKVNQISLFPTVIQQIENIAQAKAEEQTSAFFVDENSSLDEEAISFDVVDKILATGNKERNSTSLIAGFMAFNTNIAENAEYLKKHYGVGGKGFHIDGISYSFWYDKEGITIAKGNQTYKGRNKINITWEQTSERIRNLLEKGEYLTADKLDTAKEEYEKFVADYFCYMYRDKADTYQNTKLDKIEKTGSFLDYSSKVLSFLQDKEKLTTVISGLKQMEQDFIVDKKATMRMNWHTPMEIMGMVKDLENEPVVFPRKNYFAPITPTFITEDELNSIYAIKDQGENINTRKIDIYVFFKQGHKDVEKADFLKNFYGFSGASFSSVNIIHSSKGTEISTPYAKVNETWGQVAKRIDRLIAENRYISEAEKGYIPTYEKEKISKDIYLFYNYAPKDMERPFNIATENYNFINEAIKQIAQQLDNSEFVEGLIVQMEYVLEHTLSDEHGFDIMQKVFTDLKDFQNGEYSIFKKEQYTIKPEEKEDQTSEDALEDIGKIAKKLELKRKINHKETANGQLMLDFVGNTVSSILENKGLMVSEELIEFAKENLENPTNEEVAAKVEEIIEEETQLSKMDNEKPYDLQVEEQEVEKKNLEKLSTHSIEELISDEKAITEYISQKADHPHEFVGIQSGSLLLFYGEDAEIIAPVIGRKVIEREFPLVGNTKVTGGYMADFPIVAEKLKEKGINFCFIGEEDGQYHTITQHFAKDYLPLNMEITIEGRKFVIDKVNYDFDKVSLRDVTFQNSTGFPIFRSESIDYVRFFVEQKQGKIENIPLVEDEREEPQINFDFDGGGLEDTPPTLPIKERESVHTAPKINYKITNKDLGIGTAKEKFARNINAVQTLKQLETENRLATATEQEVLSQYVGWGGLADVFDDSKENWNKEYIQLKSLLTEDEYTFARASTLNAHYTSPVIIRAMYKALENMNIPNGNILEPACGICNFFGMLPHSMENAKLYGVELDNLTGRIAKQLYQKANIQIKGFEKTDFSNDFFDVAIGNVPFGNYKLNDKKYNKQNFLIHDYFFGKSLDKVRCGGIVAFITSKGTLDKENSQVRKYLAQRADLLGAIRLPNTAFKANAGTEVTSDIIFLQKRDHAPEKLPSWVGLGETENGIAVNKYFEENPNMIMGSMEMVTGPFGMESTCVPNLETTLEEQLNIAITNILEPDATLLKEPVTVTEGEQATIEATPNVRNFSYTLVDDQLYFRENSRMKPVTLNETAEKRVKNMISIRDCTRDIINMQLNECSNEELQKAQIKLNELYDDFNKKFGLINNKANKQAFVDDVSYPLLCSLENIDEKGELKSKAPMFDKRTIKQSVKVTSVDTPIEALAVSISEKASVDIEFMATLLGGKEHIPKIIEELRGIIFKDPLSDNGNNLVGWQPADEYLSGNVRKKLEIAQLAVDENPQYQVNVDMLTKVQPKELSAAEIDVRMGATWVNPKYYKQFMFELLGTPRYMQSYKIDVMYSKHSSEWNVQGKLEDRANPRAVATFGTKRRNAYQIIEDSLNLRDTRIFDTVIDDEGKEKRVLNGKETTLAQQKQEAIGEAFKEWIWKDPQRREILVKKYNEIYNSIRPREFDGQHIKFDGMNPLIKLNAHQSNAVARTLYGGNTLLAHVVGAGKSFTMIASAMEGKRLGLQQKSLFVVPNHLTEQMGGDIHTLYPGANVLVATKKDFEPANRKKFCSRIATGDFDIVVIGHSQFEKIPLSVARQEEILKNQIDEIVFAIQDSKRQNGERYTIKQLEKTKKSLEVRLQKLSSQERKDNVVTFEELGVDKLYVDEAHLFKNLFLKTKMRNVAGIGQSEAQKSTDMFTKCRYMDQLTGGKGTVFATGTPVSNSMTELYTMMRYLQYSTLEKLDLVHFDSWAANFGEKVTAIELAPEGTGFRAKTRFAKFFNLPELINIWKEAADIQTADMLNLPVPKAVHTTIVTKPSEFQREMVKNLAERANVVRKKEVEPNVDNMLRITSDGRKLALDQRLQNEMLPDDPNGKINTCIENVYNIWQESAETKGTQLIFCDLSTPHYDGTFNVYDDIKNKLMGKGVPPEEIKFIHDANTEQQKAELFAKVRSGDVRVLIGSTQKMGAGTNVRATRS